MGKHAQARPPTADFALEPSVCSRFGNVPEGKAGLHTQDFGERLKNK